MYYIIVIFKKNQENGSNNRKDRRFLLNKSCCEEKSRKPLMNVETGLHSGLPSPSLGLIYRHVKAEDASLILHKFQQDCDDAWTFCRSVCRQ